MKAFFIGYWPSPKRVTPFAASLKLFVERFGTTQPS